MWRGRFQDYPGIINPGAITLALAQKKGSCANARPKCREETLLLGANRRRQRHDADKSCITVSSHKNKVFFALQQKNDD